MMSLILDWILIGLKLGKVLRFSKLENPGNHQKYIIAKPRAKGSV
jgi:hypothetical protein